MAVDAFAGAGGATCGLTNAGYDPIALENWNDAADTHDANHQRPTIRVDLSTYDWRQLLPLVGEQPWLMWASPPCQAFSSAGDQFGEFDERDGFPWLLRGVTQLLPPVLITENVKGLTFAKHAAYFDSIIATLYRLGYDVQWRVLDAADYGKVLACPLHASDCPANPVDCAERLSLCATELASVGGAMTWIGDQPPRHVVIAAGHLVSRIARAFADAATCEERQRALAALPANEALRTQIGKVVAGWTNAAISAFGLTPATAVSIVSLLSDFWDELSRDARSSTISMETRRTIVQRISKCIAATLITGLHTGPVSRSGGCGLCVDWATPQNRERTIIIARRDGGPIVWPTPTHTEHEGLFTQRWTTMAEALGWTGEVGFPRLDDRGDSTDGYRERDWRSTELPSFAVSSKGRSWLARNVVLHTNRDQRDDGTRQTRDTTSPASALTAKSGGQWFLERPATTIACDPRVMPPGHHDPDESGSQMRDAIRVEPHELAALQAFPPGYRFIGTKTSVCTQIGNSVPPPLAEALARANRPLSDICARNESPNVRGDID